MVTADMEQERETGSTFYSMMMNAQVRQELRGREGGREEGERERGEWEGGREEVFPGNGHRRHGAGERDWECILFNDVECSSERVEREGGREGGREVRGSEGGRERGREGSGREVGCEGGRRFLQGMVTVDMEQERETESAFYSMLK